MDLQEGTNGTPGFQEYTMGERTTQTTIAGNLVFVDGTRKLYEASTFCFKKITQRWIMFTLGLRLRERKTVTWTKPITVASPVV